jgi:lysophospholipase L1-like esterase
MKINKLLFDTDGIESLRKYISTQNNLDEFSEGKWSKKSEVFIKIMSGIHSSRRNFIKATSLASGGLITIPPIVSAAFKNETAKQKKIVINKDDVILFQGDSITDAGRNKDDIAFNTASALGMGYAMIASSGLLFKCPDKNLKIYNRGISGNKVYSLAERWAKDCLDIKPNILSILIGVNDYAYERTDNRTFKSYRDDYKALLERTKQNLRDVKLIIGEPFAVSGVKAVDETWFPAFDEYRNAAKEIAKSFDAIFVPYQRVFDKAQKEAPGIYWTYDGVHASLAGAQLMAHAWMEAVKA